MTASGGQAVIERQNVDQVDGVRPPVWRDERRKPALISSGVGFPGRRRTALPPFL